MSMMEKTSRRYRTSFPPKKNRTRNRSPISLHRSSYPHLNEDFRQRMYKCKISSNENRRNVNSRLNSRRTVSSSHQGEGKNRSSNKEERHYSILKTNKDWKTGDKRIHNSAERKRRNRDHSRSKTKSRNDNNSYSNRKRVLVTHRKNESRKRRCSSPLRNRDSKQRPEEIIENRSHKKSRRYEAESLSSEGEEKRDRHGNKHTSVENQSNVETQRLNNDGENFQISDGQRASELPVIVKEEEISPNSTSEEITSFQSFPVPYFIQPPPYARRLMAPMFCLSPRRFPPLSRIPPPYFGYPSFPCFPTTPFPHRMLRFVPICRPMRSMGLPRNNVNLNQ